MDGVREIGVERVDPPVEMVRERIDPETVRELAESIRAQGLLQPILVRPKGRRYEVVAGHRRLLAYRVIGEAKIRAVVRELDDNETLVIRATENIQREDLSPMEEARVYGTLRDRLGCSMEEIARKMGRNRYTIKKYLGLLKLPEYVQEHIDARRLSLQVAIKLAEIEDVELQKYYVENAVDHGITMKVAELWIQDYEASRKAEYYALKGSQGEVKVKAEPTPVYLTCFTCHGAEEAGKLTNIQICQGCYNDIVLSRAKLGGEK